MKRYAFDQLTIWQNNPNKKPMIIQGARQVGKTWLMKEFGRTYYDKVAYISFNDNEEAKAIFESSYDVDNIIFALGILTGARITQKDTLIILDEIQESERALNALKFFKENAPQYHILAAGSLLGVAVKQKKMSFPVGQVEFLSLYPLSFCEFLDAIGENDLCKLIFDKNITLIKAFKDRYIMLLKQYMFVGGMPEAVSAFVKNKDFDEVREIQRQILLGYENDFSKYIESFHVARVKAVWNSLPSQLSKENKKFAYHLVAPSARAREYETAIEWLVLCGLVYKVSRISKPSLPLTGYEDGSIFKLFIIDCGLLCAKSFLDAKTIIDGNRIFEEFKGSLTEQYVLQEMKLRKDLPIAYWTPDVGNAEIDFVFQYGEEIIPLEVKSTTNLMAKSLASYRRRYGQKTALRTSLADFEINEGLYNIPLYMIENILGCLE